MYTSRLLLKIPIRLLSNITANAICNHFTQVLSEYGPSSHIHADFGTQYISKDFRKKCESSVIKLTFSSPYHHQTNSVAERAIRTCKSKWKKALDEKSSYSAICMHRTTPLSHNIPPLYDLMYGRKPRILIPSSNHALQSTHVDNYHHKDMNQLSQDKQAEYYNKKASRPTDDLCVGEPVYIYSTLTKTWEKGKTTMIPNPSSEPRTYIVEKDGKLYQRTREHETKICTTEIISEKTPTNT